MKSVLAVDAAEYNAATDRINSALEMLRDEMKSLRQQDVTLMRQFITMNDAIRSISKDQKTEKRRAKRMRNRSINISASLHSTTPSRPIPLVRQQSVPRYCDVIPEVRERTWSCSSDEESASDSCDSLSSSVSSLNESDEESNTMSTGVPVFQYRLSSRQRAKSLKTPVSTMSVNTVSNVETVLQNNVKLWKIGQDSSDSDNVFDESEEENL